MSKKYEVGATMISGLCARRAAKEISGFINIPLCTVYNVQKVYNAVSGIATASRKMHKLHKHRSN